jgi:hypothetical protein
MKKKIATWASTRKWELEKNKDADVEYTEGSVYNTTILLYIN